MPILQAEAISKSYGSFEALHQVSFSLSKGECLCLLGPSGAGKSTLLRLLAKLREPNTGRLTVSTSNIGMVFQDAALFPHMKVKDNIAYGLFGKYAKNELNAMVEEVSKKCKVLDQLEKYPSALSGGEKQRVSIARALIRKPDLLLLDEPTANLDARLKEEIQEILYQIHQDGLTMVLSCHDQKEAALLSDRVLILNHGCLEEEGSFDSIYHHPKSLFSATFIGEFPMNLLPYETDDQRLLAMNGWLPLTKEMEGKSLLGFRKEDMLPGNRFHIPFWKSSPYGDVGIYQNHPVLTPFFNEGKEIFFSLRENSLNFFPESTGK